MAFRISLAIALFSLIFSQSIFGYEYSKDISSWCDKMSYLKPCKNLLSNNQAPTNVDNSAFLKTSLQFARERAVEERSNTFSLGTKCQNQLEKTAWNDCLSLYDHTILKINKTLNNLNSTQEDAQTWLSTALTNLDTCQTGFAELGVSNNIPPLMSNNVSNLISNILAQIKTAPSKQPSYEVGFPSWVKPGDQKMLQASSPRADAVVAKDGSGKYKTVGEAVAAADSGSRGSGRFVIYVKQGVYAENVEIGSGLENVMLVGDGIGRTVITGSKSVGGGATTFESATVAVVGDGFIARGITFRNTAGPSNSQAVALRSGSDQSVFYQCSFEGYQDTLYVYSDRQFYKECDIYGTVDFIFGNAAAVLQNCNIYARNPPNKINTITAQGRSDPNQNTGIVIQYARVEPASDLKPVQGSVQTYLGRPWRKYSRTVFMESFLDSLIAPAGWTEWSGDFALDTLYFAEYNNLGPGSGTANRVKWKGYHVLTSASQASPFTVANFIDGGSWLPATGVPFTVGL